MKKLFLLAALFVMAASASFAQIGARIGANFASLSNNDYAKSSVGLHLGVVYNIELADALSVQPGFYISAKNLKEDITESETIKFHPTYLEIPILIKYNLDVANSIAIDPHVGPYFGFGVAGKAKYHDEKIKVFGNGDDDMNLKRFDMGLDFGCGATFSESVYVGLDYQIGFRDLLKDNYGDAERFGNFMITFGVWFQ